MKKMLIMTSLVFGSVLHSIAADANSGITVNDNVKPNTSVKASGETKATTKKATASKTLSATARANRMTDEMIRDLRLNNYQGRKLRAINLEKVHKMMAIEAKGGDPTNIDNECFGVCKQSDAVLEDVFSTDQYSKYFSNRSNYYKSDKDYKEGGYLDNASAKAEKDNLKDNDDDADIASKGQLASR